MTIIKCNPESYPESDDFITLVFKADGGQTKAIEQHFSEYDEIPSFADLLDLAKANGFSDSTGDTILAICEDSLSGEVYRYGNHGRCWERIGETCGYA